MRKVTPVEVDENGFENHPSFGMISASRVSSNPARALFDSEIKHHHYIVLSIGAAKRKRDLNHDWLHTTTAYVEVAMSESQWASFVSSMNTTGSACTIQTLPGNHLIPAAPYSPRLEQSTAYVKGAAAKMFEGVQAAFQAVKEKPTKANLRDLEIALQNAVPNVEYAAKSMTEHVENVVTKARADIEAMVINANQLGIDVPHPKLLEATEEES